MTYRVVIANGSVFGKMVGQSIYVGTNRECRRFIAHKAPPQATYAIQKAPMLDWLAKG